MNALALVCVLLIAWHGTASAEPDKLSIVAESSSLWGNPRIFVASADPIARKGDVQAHRADDLPAHAALWSAAQLLDARSDAEVLDHRLVLTTDHQQRGASLHWATLPAAMRASLAQGGIGEPQLAYLRGDRSLETAPGFRVRSSRLGDSLNANLWFTGRRAEAGRTRPAMVYGGANDGMLHGYDAGSGVERLAYVPRGLLPRLAARVQRAGKRAQVDGPLFAGPAGRDRDGMSRTLLVGALGAGGKGFFVLDISDPDQFSATNAADIVQLDLTASADADIGQIFSPPVVDDVDPNRSLQIAQLNNGRWAALMGNGYFSQAGRPVLLIQYLDEARELLQLSPCMGVGACAHAGDNGLSAPRAIDVNGDGKVDLAYAGDLQGNLWKFDLSTAASVDWGVAFSGQPFFVARDASGQRQALTTAPYWMPHPLGGLMLGIGTGRHLHADDRGSTQTQSLYVLYDDSAMTLHGGKVRIQDGNPISAGDATARPATLVGQIYNMGFEDQSILYHTATSTTVSYTGGQPHRGWWIDLPHAGQRVLRHPRGFEGQKMLVHSVVPAESVPGAPRLPWTAGAAYVSVLNLLTGHPSAHPALTPADDALSAMAIGMASMPDRPALMFRQAGRMQLRFADGQRLALRTGKTTGARTGWREQP